MNIEQPLDKEHIFKLVTGVTTCIYYTVERYLILTWLDELIPGNLILPWSNVMRSHVS